MAKKTVKKNKEGYGYKYTDLSQIHEYLEENNMQYYQEIETLEGNDYIMTYRCIDNVWEEKPKRGCRVVNAALSGIKNPAQEQGSALTYARRYSLLMAFGLATDDDDAQSLTRPQIENIDEAKKYKLTFGKYAGKTLEQVPENYLQWLLENSKDETVKTACDFLVEHLTKDESKEKSLLLDKMKNLVFETNTDLDEMLKHYDVQSNAEMTIDQLKDAIGILTMKKQHS